MKDHQLSDGFLALTLFFLSCNVINATNLTALHDGTDTLALTGYLFGIGDELSLVGTPVPVNLQEVTVAVVPIAPALWLFASGVFGLLGVGYRKGTPTAFNKTALPLSLLFLLALTSPFSFAAQDPNADLDGDARVTGQDISKLASCFGQDPADNTYCAKADVDADGDIDGDDFRFVSVRLGQTYPETLFHDVLPPPSFTTSNEGGSNALGEVNGDEVLVVANWFSNDISVLLGKGDSRFQTQQRLADGHWPESIALDDVNGDGVLDAVAANWDSRDISVLLGNGDGSFQTQQRFAAGERPRSIALGDMNGDGVLDAVVANWFSNDISVLLGNGDGSFQTQQRFATGEMPHSIALGDINKDGVLDAVVANLFSNDISVLFGNSDGGFQTQQRFTAGDRPNSIVLGDVNGDGVLDAVVANWDSNDISVLLGNSDGSFQNQQRFAAGSLPQSIALGDMNRDGVLDAVVANWGSYDISVLIGNGDGGFQVQKRFNASYPQSIALGDRKETGRLIRWK